MCECQRSYKALSCSCPRSGDRMLSMFCLTASYALEFLVDIFFRWRGGLARIMPDMSGTAYGFRMGMENFITPIAFYLTQANGFSSKRSYQHKTGIIKLIATGRER